MDRQSQRGRIGCFSVLFLAFLALSAISSYKHYRDKAIDAERAARDAEVAKQEAERKRQEEAANSAYFREHKQDIISRIQALIKEGQYGIAIAESDKYLAASDPDLQKAQDKARELDILQNLKSVAATDYRRNRDIYAALVQLNPNEKRYKDKLTHYQAKVDAAEKEERDRLAKFGPFPERNPNGIYYAVLRYLRTAMHDPDSLDMEGCTNVYQGKNGWLVGCIYRGKNAFGAKVRNANWFTIRHGMVVKVEDADAYKW